MSDNNLVKQVSRLYNPAGLKLLLIYPNYDSPLRRIQFLLLAIRTFQDLMNVSLLCLAELYCVSFRIRL